MRAQLTDVIMCQIFSRSVQGLWSSVTPKIAISHWLAASPLQQCTHCCATLWYVQTCIPSHLRAALTVMQAR